MIEKRFFRYHTFLFRAVFLLTVWFVPFAVSAQTLPQETLADLMKPSVVRIAEHVSGKASVVPIKVDIKNRLVAVNPAAAPIEVDVDEYLTGSGFIIHPDGYIATNSHVVSMETVKLMLASENALAALFENALLLSEEEMQEFQASEDSEDFTKRVLQFVIDESEFDLTQQVAVLRPDSEKQNIDDLITEGFPAEIISVNPDFVDDERDVAIIRIGESNLPAVSLGNSGELSVGKKMFIFGFPATAELNQGNASEATFTQGVVSAIKRSTKKDFDIFQTDAKVSEGSSGGPLFDENGEVVGMVTFQTDELNRVTGDNFAFALPIEMLREVASEHEIVPVAGAYETAFREGFDALSDRRCEVAVRSFDRAKAQSNDLFVPNHYTDPYYRRCEELKAQGETLDTRWERFRQGTRALGNPFFYLLGGSLILFSLFGAAIFWLLRQVRREEHDIHELEERLLRDEIRLKRFQQGNRHETPTSRPLAQNGETRRTV